VIAGVTQECEYEDEDFVSEMKNKQCRYQRQANKTSDKITLDF
jgi:hypothetical protein